MDNHDKAEEKLLVGYRQLAAFLTAEGYPTSKSTISKYCSPAINIGPPVEAYWGKLPAFSPSRARNWAKARMRPPHEARAKNGSEVEARADHHQENPAA
jgi:hypothetical protein